MSLAHYREDSDTLSEGGSHTEDLVVTEQFEPVLGDQRHVSFRDRKGRVAHGVAESGLEDIGLTRRGLAAGEGGVDVR